MESTSAEEWTKDFQNFLEYWLNEVDVLKEKHLGSEECYQISDLFQRDRNILLCMRPTSISDDELVSKLQPLTQKLDTSLAIALCSMRV